MESYDVKRSSLAMYVKIEADILRTFESEKFNAKRKRPWKVVHPKLEEALLSLLCAVLRDPSKPLSDNRRLQDFLGIMDQTMELFWQRSLRLRGGIPKKRPVATCDVKTVDIGSNVLVDQYLLRQLELTESAPGPFSRGLLCIVFTKEERAGKSLFGKKSNSHKNDPVKPGLDPVRVQAVIALQAQGRVLDAQTIAEALCAATRTVQVPTTRPNPDFQWLLLRAQRRRAQRRARRTRLPEDKAAFRRSDALFKRHGRRLAREQWALKCESLDGRGGTASAWRMARTLANRPRPRHPIVTLAIRLHIPTQDAVEMAADALLAPPPLPPSPAKRPRQWSRFAPPTADEMVGGQGDLQMYELRRAIAALPRRRSAPGPDGVTNAALRNLDESAHPDLLAHLNEAWRSAVLPPEWRTATVVPVLKPGKPADQLSSYRPIALTSCVGKLLERIVMCRLVHHLETVGALPDCYAGFRRGRCTADAIADLATTLEDGKARRRTTGVVFLDIASAFDGVLHSAIVDSLTRLGVRGRALRYVRAFLQGREARLRASGLYSAPRTLTRGVPQGSVLSQYHLEYKACAFPPLNVITSRSPQRPLASPDEQHRLLHRLLHHLLRWFV
ncbi:hypothetical protein ISCGN_000073 [Ixodes scapularis]